MKNSINSSFVALLLLVNIGLLYGQEKRIEIGDKLYDQYAYKKAIILYEEALVLNPKKWELYAKLGDCYYNLSDTKNALNNYDKYYTASIENKMDISTAFLLRYAVCLHNDGRTPESIEIYKKLGESVKPKDKTDLIDVSQSKLERLTAINSDSSDFGTFIYKNTLYFSSTRKNPEKEKRLNKKIYKWNEEPFLDIYEAVIDNNNESLSLKPITSEYYSLKNINTIAHEASVALTKDGDTMYYAGGEVKNNKLVYNKRGTSNLKLKRVTWDSGLQQWVVNQKDTAMNHFDFVNYSIGNPALSPDYKRLYFVTCAPFSKAQGRTDIYYVNILNGGTSFGKVTSVLGVNTAGRESFPFIASDGTLYFSSDGVYQKTKSDPTKDLGLGLLDIYKVENLDHVIQKYEHDLAKAKTANDSTEINKKMQTYFEKGLVVEHLRKPFNSEWDDFAFFIEETKKDKDSVYAYFSSNRDGDIRNDDIYRTKVKIESYKTIKVEVTDSLSQKLIGNAFVDLFDSEGKLIKTVQDSTGSYLFKLKVGEDYKVRGYAVRYDQDFKTFNSKTTEGPIILKLKPIPCEFSISNIEFRFNKDTLDINVSADSLELKKLDELIRILMTNRDIKIKIESYTDSRGPTSYNLELSERRAQTTKQYLIKNEVNENQILSAKGFGENCPIVSEAEINKLSTKEQRESAHTKNRRSRFILDCQEVLEGCQALVQNN